MDAIYTGKKILELRKSKGITQRELAAKINVTDKAVSKWERGLNFPDLFALECLSKELDTSIVELLELDESAGEQVALDITALAHREQLSIIKEIVHRGWITVILGLILFCGEIYASWVLAANNLYGRPQMATMGMLGYIGIIIANGLVSILKGRRLHPDSGH